MAGIRRALVLGSGGVSGIAWQLGVLNGLAEAGLPLDADVVVGTSAGAVVGARLTLTGAVPGIDSEPDRPGRLGVAALARLLAAQVAPSRRRALVGLGARAARAWSPEVERAWVARFAEFAGLRWPESLVVVATEAATGRPAFFTARHPADLAAAVAASCAVPGVFPAVRIDGRLYFDGGLRSPANLDLAEGSASVLALAPLSGSVRAHRRPGHQAAQLTRSGSRVALLRPGVASRWELGPDVFAPERVQRAFSAGRRDAERRRRDVLAAWGAVPTGGSEAPRGD